ncbi:MAG: glycosyltransferase family 2 protein, partial [Acidobacteria bacterium]|nr:glycosyltransferase family 2 protein [Acidobacteriota bacterium]
AEEVIVVDNGSTDRTAQVAKSFGTRVLRESERGYGAACLRGIKALGPEIDVVVFLDGDYSDYPEEMEELVAPIADNVADFVVGSRTLLAQSRKALSFQQRFGNGLATRLVQWRFGFRYTDLGPFRAIRRDALDSLRMRDRGFGWTVEMQMKAACAGLRIQEVPVRYRSRVGRSKVSGTVRGAVGAGTKILYTIARHALTFEDCGQGLRSTRASGAPAS